MPTRPMARCTQCRAMATHHGRCDDHQRKAWANPSANSRALTGAQRRTFRAAVMSAAMQERDGRCAWCPNLATEADHILAIGLGGSPTDARHNGQALCSECHELKTESDKAQERARRTSKS